MNIHDKPRARCDAKERDPRWYAEYFQKQEAKRLKRELARQQQQERVSESQEIIGTQSQEPTLYESEMRDSIDARPRHDDPNKATNTSRDVILKRLIYTAGGSKADHESDSNKKKKKHVTSWISKYHFHESLLKDSDKEAQNLKSAAANGVRAEAAAFSTHSKSSAVSIIAAVAPVTGTASLRSNQESMAVTNSPSPSLEPGIDTASQSTVAKNASPKNRGNAAIKKEQNKEHTCRKRSRDEVSRDVKDGEGSSTVTKSERPKKRSKQSNGGDKKSKNKKSDVKVITHHENGHDVLEIIDDSGDDGFDGVLV